MLKKIIKREYGGVNIPNMYNISDIYKGSVRSENTFLPWNTPNIPKLTLPQSSLFNTELNKYTSQQSSTSSQQKDDPDTGGETGVDLKGALETAGSFMGSVQNMTFNNSPYASDSNAELQNKVRSGISDAAIKSGNPIAMAIGVGTKIVDSVMDSTGTRSYNITKDDTNKMGISNAARIYNNANNFLPGNFMAIGGSRTIDASKSLDSEELRGAYSGALQDIDTAQNYGGKKFNFLLGGMRRKANRYIKEQNEVDKILTKLNRTSTKGSESSQEFISQNFNRLNGNQQQIQINKNGGVIKLQNGGSILIPKGALHARKHHMDEFNPELADELTKKGIPIIATDDKGNVEQVAEVEKEEIILEKSLTEKIESLWKKGDEESMIKAGKLIVDTLFNNCDDNVNLIKNTK